MVKDEFEPSVTRLFCLVNVGVLQNVPSLNLSPLFAEATFGKMLKPILFSELTSTQKMGLRSLGCI